MIRDVRQAIRSTVFGQAIAMRIEFLRYLVAGAIAFLADVALFLALIRLAEVRPVLAALAGYGAGLILVYLLSVRWVFGYRRLRARHTEFAYFAVIGVIGLAVNVAVIGLLTEVWQIDSLVAKLIATGMTFTFNFIFRKLMLFSRWVR